MKIPKLPKTTLEEPYIQFVFDKKGNLKLSKTASWWGGKNSYFVTSTGSKGNTCEPKHLESYIKAFQKRQIHFIEKQIAQLQKELEKWKRNTL